MNEQELDTQIRAAADAFNNYRDALYPSTLKLIRNTNFVLTRLLLTVASIGDRFPVERLRSTAMSLEFLDQAAYLALLSRKTDNLSDQNLLGTDYFYAEAIKQVVGLDDPRIIAILARAIADTAAARASGDTGATHLKYLVAAAVELGLMIGGCDSNLAEIVHNVIRSRDSDIEDRLFAELTALGIGRETI